MHYNRVFLLGTALNDPVKGKSLPEKYWFRLGVRRDDNYKITDRFWITGLVSNLDNMANKRIEQFVRKGRMVLIEGVIQEWKDKDGKPYNIILAKLIRVELPEKITKSRRLLTKVMKGEAE